MKVHPSSEDAIAILVKLIPQDDVRISVHTTVFYLIGLTHVAVENSSHTFYRQGNLVCCSPCGCQESDTTEHLDNKMSIGNKMNNLS